MTNCFSRGLALAVLVAGSVASASAQLVFDRGLPTANLNNAAGADRSNVGWGFTGAYFSGDDFTLGGSGSYNVTDIRTWVVGAAVDPHLGLSDLYSSLTLWLGPGGANNNVTAFTSNFTATKVQYAGGADYQGSQGGYDDLWQVDWNTTGLVINAGALENFGVSGVTTAAGATALGYSDIVFNHASNAARSGSPQQGADNLYYDWQPGGFADPPANDSNGHGWDKSSDINVQVFATPEPFTMSLGFAAAGLFIRRRMKAKKA